MQDECTCKRWKQIGPLAREWTAPGAFGSGRRQKDWLAPVTWRAGRGMPARAARRVARGPVAYWPTAISDRSALRGRWYGSGVRRRCGPEWHRCSRAVLLSPGGQLRLNAGADCDLWFGRRIAVARFPPRHFLARQLERLHEIAGAIERVHQEGVAEAGELRLLAAAERGTIRACGRDDHGSRSPQRRDEAAGIAGVDDHHLVLERVLAEDAGQILRADLVQR